MRLRLADRVQARRAFVLLVLAATATAGAAARADVLYTDGTNPITHGLLISGSNQLADSFRLTAASTLSGATFRNLLQTGDSAYALKWAIVGSEGSQTPVCAGCSGTATLTSGTTAAFDQYYSLVDQSFSLPAVTLNGGTYWLKLTGEVISYRDSGYWAMDGGPSGVWSSLLGDLGGSDCSVLSLPANSCSNAFSILGTAASVPEPASPALLGTGAALLGLAVARRRRPTG